MPGPSITSIIDAVTVDRDLEHACGELEGSLLMASLIIASGRQADQKGIGLGEFLDQIQALLQEHQH